MILMGVKFLSEIAMRCQFIKVDRDPSRLDNKIRIGLASLFVNFVTCENLLRSRIIALDVTWTFELAPGMD